jgi:hypothetical protein
MTEKIIPGSLFVSLWWVSVGRVRGSHSDDLLSISSQFSNGACRAWSTTVPVVRFRRSDSEVTTEEPLRYVAMTGLSDEQLVELVARVHAVHGGFFSRGRRPVLGLFRSVVLVVCVLA